MIASRTTAIVLASMALMLAATATSRAAGRPDTQRIVVVQEGNGFIPGEALVDTAGHLEALVEPTVGVNGGIAVSASGTLLAEVDTAIPQLPGQTSASPPAQSTFTLAPLVDSLIRPTAGSSFALVFFGRERGLDAPRGRPSWAPGGRHVVCAFGADGRTHLRVVSVLMHGGWPVPANVRALTRGPGSDLDPAWSPDGRWIVYEHAVGASTVLMAIRPDGSDPHVVVDWAGRARYPAFDPSGRSLVFASDVSGHFQLYVMPADGGPARRLTSDAGDDTHASWSPDGRWIAYSGTADGDDEVYLVDARGGSPRQLTHNASEDLVAGWQAVRTLPAPVVHIVSVRATQTAVVARYTATGKAPFVRVDGALHISAGGQSSDDGALPSHVDPRSRGLKTLRFPEFESDLLEVPDATRVRVCAYADDPWGDAGPQSCRSASIQR